MLKITVYRETVYVRLDEVDFLMEAENIDDFPENYRPLLSIRGTPFIIHGVIDNYIRHTVKKPYPTEITQQNVQSVIGLKDPYFGTLLAIAAGSDIIVHPDPKATPYANGTLSLLGL
ncbi:hypothetical protein P792_03330 [Asaia sp. SF2.1]|nr:hypothetical protein P792_03330 [Asaia sp. SF2.1]